MTDPRVLLVGPYERDNVGDLLFLLVTERYLEGAEVVAAAPFSADMHALLGRRVHAYRPLLEHERFDAVWTVGGQVGALTPGRAYRMAAPAQELDYFLDGTRWRRRAIVRGFDLGVSPYIPDVGPLNADAVRVVNSAGLSGIRTVPRRRRGPLIALLREQDRIGVRDKASSRYLTELDIPHELVPDAVHALGLLHPLERDPQARTVVFQLSAAILRVLGPDAVASALTASPALRDRPLRFVAAGVAPGHDSLEDYEALAALVRDRRPGADVDVHHDRDPFAIVEQIAGAGVVIGTSLHVRIVAAAYAVPRVSLTRAKTTRYAQTWDPRMPHDVALADLDAAVVAALRAGAQPRVRDRAAELTHLADDHLRRLARTTVRTLETA